MTIIILAAGYAVRLEPLTLNRPKPLLDVAGRTILDRIVDKVSVLGGDHRIYIVSNAKFFDRFVKWARGSIYKDSITVINDGTVSNETRLGAIKDMALAIDSRKIDDDTLVIAGDNLFDMDLSKFMKFASARIDGVSVALYDIKDMTLAGNFGVVKTGANEQVTGFEEKPKAPKSTLVSTGIYYFPKNKLANIGKYVKLQDKLDAPGYYLSWLAKTDKVYGFRFSEDWYDIGSIESYNRANAEYLKKERKNDKA